MSGISKKRELGDYQTPVDFAMKVCKFLQAEFCLSPSTVIEPTCGQGNFLQSACECFPNAKFFGNDINKNYIDEVREKTQNYDVQLRCGNFFDLKLRTAEIYQNGNNPILILGNPPWVTNSSLSSVESQNIPTKENFKNQSGLEAMTGSSNFDICENIILRLVDDFKSSDTMIAMLCKNTVARNIFSELHRRSVSFEFIKMFNFDAKKIFGVCADACLFVLKMSKQKMLPHFCRVFDLDFPKTPLYSIGIRDGKIFSGEHDTFIDGKCCFEWRQGLKHDCSKVMELACSSGCYKNGFDENVEVEDNFIFPLIKSSHIKTAQISSSKKYVLVPQHHIKERTEELEFSAPKIWHYLRKHRDIFNNRKSSIYKHCPPFGIFGIGKYSFTPFKVAISGFYKKPLFSLISLDKSAMLDDTCYFIPFDDYWNGYVAMLLLNSAITQNFLLGITFPDSKRPFTKKVLERIDFQKCLQKLTFEDFLDTEKKLSLPQKLTKLAYNSFKEYIRKPEQLSLF